MAYFAAPLVASAAAQNETAGQLAGLFSGNLNQILLPLTCLAVAVLLAIALHQRHAEAKHSRALTIAKQKLQEESLRLQQSAEYYRRLFVSNPQPMWVYDTETLRFLEANEAAQQKYGYSQEEFRNLTIEDIRPSEEIPRLSTAVATGLSGLNGGRVWQHRAKDGTIFPAVVRGYKFRSEGAVRELVLSQDVSKQIEVQEALLRSQDKLRSLIDHAPFGVFRSSITGDRFETVNPEMLRLLGGYSLEEATQLRLSQQFYARAKDRDLLLEILLTNGSVSGFETAIVRRDGSSIPVRLSGTVSRSGEGAPDCFQGYLEDLTAQSSLEQQFRQAQKLEAVGRLAGGVAHDFNNILLVIKLSTELMLQQVTTDNPLTKSLLQIAQATERATSLTKQLLALGRRQIMQARVINLNTVVSDTSKMLQRIIGEDIHLVTRLSESLDNAKLDPDQFTQVLLNLAVNARDAMSDGGVLEIATSNVELDDAYAAMHHPVQPGRYVMVVVSDSGTGIEKSTLPRIFDPFFTTKDVGKGTGLGLSIVYGIVKQSGGYIWVYSEPGQGTTFKLYFPVVEAAVAATTTTHSNSMTAASGQIMLLVENEDLIRSNMRECLRQMGYRVLEAANAEEALEIARREKGAIDLLLTDLVLTGMRGDELAKGFANLHPHAGVLFMSGYTEETAARRDIFEAGSSFLQKPFSVADLAHAVSAALSVATSEI